MTDVRSVAIVVPVYNEAEALPRFHSGLISSLCELHYNWTIFYVDDGSTDATHSLLVDIATNDRRVTVLELSRNFGHQAALAAGLDAATADVIITMDGDGQHPCELIKDMLGLIDAGYDIVLTQRAPDATRELSFLKKLTSSFFYSIVNNLSDRKITPASADFRAMSSNAANSLKQMGEFHKFYRGMVAWAGFKTAILPFVAPPRFAGETKYSLVKMIRLANAAIFSFSVVPAQIVAGLGLLFVLLAIVEAGYVLSLWLLGQQHVLAPGWSSLMFVLLLLGGMIMVSLGVLGIYIGYIFQEVKHRPAYIVRARYGQALEPDRN